MQDSKPEAKDSSFEPVNNTNTPVERFVHEVLGCVKLGYSPPLFAARLAIAAYDFLPPAEAIMPSLVKEQIDDQKRKEHLSKVAVGWDLFLPGRDERDFDYASRVGNVFGLKAPCKLDDFSTDGKFSATISDRDGTKLDFVRNNSVTIRFKDGMQFSIGKNLELVEILKPNQDRIQFQYDVSGNVTKVAVKPKSGEVRAIEDTDVRDVDVEWVHRYQSTNEGVFEKAKKFREKGR